VSPDDGGTLRVDEEAPAMRVVALKCEVPAAHRYRRAVSADARALHKLLSLDNHELSLVLTGDPSIQKLNRAFRGKDRPTDVLSFPQLDNFATAMPEHGSGNCEIMPAALGDVVISVDTALRQAKRLGVTPEARLRTLLIHGVLHLLGYDHEKSRAEARRMFARERELAAILASGKKSCGWGSSAALLPEIGRHP
jgi:rRNA maturation RNase YbeY